MEIIEKKQGIKISLSTFFLILALIVIAIMTFFMYKTYSDKQNKIAELNSQANNLQVTIDTLEGKIESVSNVINTDDIENTNISSGESNSNSTINMEDIYLPQTFKLKGEKATAEANFNYYIEEEKNYIKVKVTNSEIECSVLNNNMKPIGFKAGKTVIKGCNERVVDVAFEYNNDGFVSSIFLLTSSKNVYACNIRYLYDISNDGIQANLILKDVISIGTTSGGYSSEGYTVVALRENGKYAICFDGESEGE